MARLLSPFGFCAKHLFTTLSPDSDKIEISLYLIPSFSNKQVMIIKKVLTKDNMS